MVSRSPAGLRVRTKDGVEPAHGPYACCELRPDGYYVRLNDAGRAVLAEWMTKYPHPVALLRTRWPLVYSALRHLRVSDDDIDAACVLGCVVAVVRWQPERASLSTAVGWNVRAAATELLRNTDRHESREHPCSDWWDRERDDADAPSYCEPVARPDGPDPDAAADVAALVEKAGLGDRARRILFARAGGVPLRELGAEEHRTRERVRQVAAAAVRRLRVAAGTAGPDELPPPRAKKPKAKAKAKKAPNVAARPRKGGGG